MRGACGGMARPCLPPQRAPLLKTRRGACSTCILCERRAGFPNAQGGVKIYDHALPVAQKLRKGFLAWRQALSPLRRGQYLELGVWHHLGCFEGFDHLACIGWTHLLDSTAFQGADASFFWDASEWFKDLIHLLRTHAEGRHAGDTGTPLAHQDTQPQQHTPPPD